MNRQGMKHRPLPNYKQSILVKRASPITLFICAILGFGQVEAEVQTAEVSPPEVAISQLAFMEGSWRLTTFIYDDDGSIAKQSSANMTFKPLLGGLGYLEERIFPNDKPDNRTYSVALIYSVKPETGKLVGILNNTLGNRKLLNQIDGENLAFKMTGELFNSAQGYALLRYTNILENGFEMVQDYCPGENEPCQERVFSFRAKRIE